MVTSKKKKVTGTIDNKREKQQQVHLIEAFYRKKLQIKPTFKKIIKKKKHTKALYVFSSTKCDILILFRL